MLATGFAVLLGFVVFLAFESYDTSRSGAEAEAQIVAQQFETAQFLPVAVRAQPLRRARLLRAHRVHQEWPQMESGTLGDAINPWGVAMFRTLQTVEPQSASEQAAYAKWLDQRSDREDARADRIHGAEGVIPLPLWIVLFLSAAIIFVFMLFFADSAERAVVQATMMGGVAVVIIVDAAAALVPRQPVPRRRRRPAADGDGAHARDPRPAVRRSSALTFGHTCDARGVAR